MCSTEHMSGVSTVSVRYRLPGAAFPLRFRFWEREWRLELVCVSGAGHWRCMIEGPQSWYVCCGNDHADLEQQLTGAGIEIRSRTFVGTVFRQLAHLGVAEIL
jgi:hypothetical protein